MVTKDLAQQRFGLLIAINRVGTKVNQSGRRRALWRCICDCGGERIAVTSDLTGGNTTSCGCKSGKTEHSFSGSLEERFWSKVKKLDDCWEWIAYVRKDGYGYFGLAKNKPAKAHRLSWELVNGPIPDGLHILHRCDNRKCVNPEHLFLGTDQDNMDDMWAKGRQQSYTNQVRGSSQHASVFTSNDVLEIRRHRNEDGVSIRKLAASYGVAYNTIWQIVNRKTWAHI